MFSGSGPYLRTSGVQLLTLAKMPQTWPARLQHGQRPQQVGDALARHFRDARNEVGLQALPQGFLGFKG